MIKINNTIVTQEMFGDGTLKCPIPPIETARGFIYIPPRIRMTTLYAIAQTLGYRVIGTGNASEAYIGWTTKWGDSAYDFNPIAHLTLSLIHISEPTRLID